MAATRLIALHVNKGRTVAQCLGDRTDYATNPEKTEKGELVSSYECDPVTVDEEFMLSKRQYFQITGKSQKNDVIAYQIRQSFKPGEITPEEANRLGYELAMRFTKGKYAFIVATHTDRAHIHNHIVFNSTAIDDSRKFKNFWLSSLSLQRLSDLVCLENGYSVIQPKPFEELLLLLQAEGYEIKQGKNIALKGKSQQRFIRLSSLGEGYSEAELRAVIAGEIRHQGKEKTAASKPQRKMTEVIPENFITLSVRVQSLDESEIRGKYSRQVAEKLISSREILEPLIGQSNNSFAIRVDHYHYETKKRSEATELYHIEKEASEGVRIISKLKDPNDTHKYNMKTLNKEINKRLKKERIILLDANKRAVEFNQYHFRLFCD